jgi:hypothetical protein
MYNINLNSKIQDDVRKNFLQHAELKLVAFCSLHQSNVVAAF